MNIQFTQLKEERKSFSLKEIADIKYGFGLPERNRKVGCVPVYGSSGIVGWHDEAKTNTPAIVIGRKGTVGSVYYSNVGCYPIDTSYYVDEVKSGFDIRYVYYLLTSLKLSRYSGDSAVPGLSRDTLYSLVVNLPTLSTQIKIANILSLYDEKIENNNKIIKGLESTAQAIFDEWFVKFRFPGHEKVKTVESEMGEIPEGWAVRKLGDVMELAYGKALKEEDRVPGDIAVIGSSGIVGSHTEKVASGPGIVIGRKGNAGSVIWVDSDFYPIDTTFYVKTEFPIEYCFFLLNKQIFSSSDSAVPGLNRDVAYLNHVLIADEATISLFRVKASSIFQTISSLRKESSLLKSLRDSLLVNLV